MPTFAFTATVTGLDVSDDAQIEALAADSFVLVPGDIDGVISISVEIDAASGEDALRTFTDHLKQAAPHVDITRLDEDLVNIPEIATRLDLDREMVRLLTMGKRGDGDFPKHRTVIGQQKIWAWAAVHAWALVHSRLPADEPHPLDSSCVDWFNGHLTPAAERPTQPDPVIQILVQHHGRHGQQTWWHRNPASTTTTLEVVRITAGTRTDPPYSSRSGQRWTYGRDVLACEETRVHAR